MILAVGMLGAELRAARAEGIYTWTDERGGVHYSNRGALSGDAVPRPGADGGEAGWESVLERKQGGPEAAAQAEAAINSMQVARLRKKREREHAREELEATQARITRAQSLSPAELPALKAREAAQAAELRRLDTELGLLDQGIAQLRARKSAEAAKDQRPAP